ncbi:hypothetical protein ACWD0J_41215, partial [Streptomyces sp. NPDC003011]
VAFDGCLSVKTPDAERNRGWLGRIKYRSGWASYPAMMLMALVETGTRGLLGAVFGPRSEMQSPATTDFTGVAETALWTLYHRAAEAARKDTVLPDPQAVRLVAQLNFPFRQRLGRARPWVAQILALRALAFDGVVRSFLSTHPDGTVIALGEGLAGGQRSGAVALRGLGRPA